MGRNLIETVMGAVVLLVTAIFLFFAWDMAQVKAVQGYDIKAVFFRVGGLTKGSDVRIAGIKVGTVDDIRLDPSTYDAVITMSVSADVKVPVDSSATISAEGLLGGKYVRIEPGSGKEMLTAGASIENTHDYRALEDQVGEIIFLATGGDGPK